MRNTFKGESIAEHIFVHEYDIFATSCEFEKVVIKRPAVHNNERVEDVVFIEPRQRFLNEFKEKKLLDRLFTAKIWTWQSDPYEGMKTMECTGVFHVAEYRNYGKNRELTLDKVCDIEELEEYKIKR